MTDEQLTEWCVAKVREWLATGHPSAWRAWVVVEFGLPICHLGIYAMKPRNGAWVHDEFHKACVWIHGVLLPRDFASSSSRAKVYDILGAILPGARKISTWVTSEDMERLLEEAAAVATNPADWRTLDAVPEDYYAL